MRIEEFTSLLHGVKQNGKQYTAKCPAHDDNHQSLAVSTGDNGGIVLHCHAGCQTEDIVTRMGLKLSDLMPDKQTKSSPIVATYLYMDIDGKLLAKKFRREDKTFFWQHADGKKGMPKVPLLYNTHALLSEPIFIVEGEKDVDTMESLCIGAVSPPNGANSVIDSSFNEYFKNKTVFIIPDNDKPGMEFAIKTANQLYGMAKDIRILELKQLIKNLPEHGDISDVYESAGIDTTLEAIIELCSTAESFAPTEITAATREPPRTPSLVKASDVPYEPPRWLMPPYFQRGKGTLVQADNGTGKTAFMCAIAAHVSTGRPLLDVPVVTPGNVLILSVEDDLPVLRGRIEASDGDLDKCHFMTNAAGMTFNSPEVEQAVKQVNAKMVIFDPFQAFLGADINMDKSNQTRPELAKLFEMADRNDCAVAIIAHMGKGSFGSTAVNRSLGSVDIPSAMRSIFQITRNPNDEDECIAVHIKCSNAPKGRSIAYTIGDRGGVHWNGYSDMTAEDLNAIVKRKEKGVPYENEPLVQVFNQLIADKPGGGFWSYADLKSEGAKILGFPPYSDVGDLRKRLDCGLAKELQKNDGLIVTHSEKGRANARGIKIEQYQLPQGYQSKIQEG